MPLFSRLRIFVDPEPRVGADQMALDEALLEGAESPVLRVYAWDGPAVSFGYSQSAAQVRRQCPGASLVRRWTGGGVVEHGADWTFALVVPAGDPVARLRPSVTYREVHAAMRGALGFPTCLQESAPPPGPPGTCFLEPSRDDVMGGNGRKICGGAQRRTRGGFLHQGSLQGVMWPADLAGRLASVLSARSEDFTPGEKTFQRMRVLTTEKYGTPEWLDRVP